MYALRKIAAGSGNMLYSKVSEPVPKEKEVKIRVLFTGICGSDLHAFKGEYNKVIPLTLGHEFVGEVVAVGKDVSKIGVGTIVSSETTFEVCEKCEYCLAEEYNLCSSRKGLGTQIDGSFAEYLIAKEDRCHVIPASVEPKIAALLEPLACCVHAAVEKTTVEPHEKIAVFGPGPIGLIMSLVLKAYGAEVILIGISKDEQRLALAKNMGIDYVINSQKSDLLAQINQLTEKQGVSQVFECSGSIQAVHSAFKIVRKKGKVIQEGLFSQDMNAIDMSLFIHKEIDYLGSRTQKPSSWKTALHLLETHKINLEPVISKIMPLRDWEQAFALAMSAEELKILMVP
ncbi:zinc-binding dehydrogenase [Enterococcus rivorum]|uniref:Sorbitol dehydrogenase n=1 Tax=Enterococcus rivorum TaxID=762845 RepID=A0A1E5KUQ5_9ENTE|nr:zinc-binding dehydrogenase [Enterococcus rivorum]MBP2100511.1 L-iditol 2-dehydrogenase [Enterococcus rivorum]OEH81635.1 sorbitol dehydrogenase [Enterococcus rivorum]